MKEKLIKYIDDHKDELFLLLSELVKIDTQNFRTYGREEAGQKFLEEYCKKIGLETDIYCPDDVEGLTEHEAYLSGRGTGKRPNFTALLRGNKGDKKIHFAAHMDTVPIGDTNRWTVEPIGGLIKDNKVWGRGSSDDKSGIAASIFLLKALKECGITLDCDVYATAYADEESGGGNGTLAACLKYPSDVYVNLDGSGIWPYATGGQAITVSFHRNENKSEYAEMLEAAAIVTEGLDKFGKNRFDEMEKDPIFRGSKVHQTAYSVKSVSFGQDKNMNDMMNISVTFYAISIEEEVYRELDGIFAEIDERLSKMGFTFDGITFKSRYFPIVYPKGENEEANLFASIFSETKGSVVTPIIGWLSDLNLYQKYGSNKSFNVGVNKGFGVYGGAHQPDEHVDCDDLLAVTKAMAIYLFEKNK